jgi:hypothetical protein
MGVCQNLPLGALSSRSAPSMLVGSLFKKFGLFLNTTCMQLLFSSFFKNDHSIVAVMGKLLDVCT